MKIVMAALLAGGLCSLAVSQTTLSLYAPAHSIKDQGISVKPWGSGTIAETDEIALEGTTSVRIFSRNYFQGGILTFASPVDLAKQFSDPTQLLELTFRVADDQMLIPAKGSPSPMGLPPGVSLPPGVHLPPGVKLPPGVSIPGSAQNAPGAQTPGGQETKKDTLQAIRIVVTTTDNLRSEMYIPVASSFAADRGWRSTAFPLSAITGFSRTNKIVKEIAISTDVQATLFIGSLQLASDTTPISVDLNADELNLPLGAQVELKARGYAGATLLKYEWDFDSSDGIQVDATGPAVKRRFNKAGTYTVTVTVSDLYGQKAPAVKTLNVVVNP